MKVLVDKTVIKTVLLIPIAIVIVFLASYYVYKKYTFYRTFEKIKDEPQKQLYLALVKGDFNLFNEALRKGADPDFDGYIIMNGGGVYIPTPLYYAIKTGNVRFLRILIREGADVNKGIGKECTPPLHFAIDEGNCKIIGMLIGYGARLKSDIERCSYYNIIKNDPAPN